MSPAVDMILCVSIVVAVALLGAAILPRRSAALRHWVLLTGLACAAVLPVISWVVPAWPVPSMFATLAARDAEPSAPAGDGQVNVVLAIPAPTSVDESLARRPPAFSDWPWSTAFAVVWIAGAVVGLSRLGWGLWRLSRLAAHARPLVSGRLAREANRLAASMRVSSPVRVLEARGVPLLVTWGARHPTVLFPEEARRWTDARVAVVLRHEFAHVVRLTGSRRCSPRRSGPCTGSTRSSGSRAGACARRQNAHATTKCCAPGWTPPTTRLTCSTRHGRRALGHRAPRWRWPAHRASKGESWPCSMHELTERRWRRPPGSPS